MELAEDIAEVICDRFGTQVQRVGDGGIALPLR